MQMLNEINQINIEKFKEITAEIKNGEYAKFYQWAQIVKSRKKTPHLYADYEEIISIVKENNVELGSNVERPSNEIIFSGIVNFLLYENYALAKNSFETLVTDCHPMAMNNLGTMYYYGKGVTQSYEKALDFYRKAAELGNHFAMNNLGCMYYQGKGVAPNYEEAFNFYQKAAKLGDHFAMNYLGTMYFHGKGVAQNYEEALKFYRRAEKLGNRSAMNYLGYMYYHGKGVAPNYEEALNFFLKAAELGGDDAMFNLGYMYEQGKVVAQNYEEALKFYLKAAEINNDDKKINYILLVCKKHAPLIGKHGLLDLFWGAITRNTKFSDELLKFIEQFCGKQNIIKKLMDSNYSAKDLEIMSEENHTLAILLGENLKSVTEIMQIRETALDLSTNSLKNQIAVLKNLKLDTRRLIDNYKKGHELILMSKVIEFIEKIEIRTKQTSGDNPSKTLRQTIESNMEIYDKSPRTANDYINLIYHINSAVNAFAKSPSKDIKPQYIDDICSYAFKLILALTIIGAIYLAYEAGKNYQLGRSLVFQNNYERIINKLQDTVYELMSPYLDGNPPPSAPLYPLAYSPLWNVTPVVIATQIDDLDIKTLTNYEKV